MLEVGKEYEFRMIEGGDEISFVGIVEKVEHPLIKLEDTPPFNLAIKYGDDEPVIAGGDKSYPGRVINVTSPNFISAQERVR